MERRDFLIKAGRMIIAGILAFVTILAFRRGRSGCSESPFCSNCSLLAGCSLPGALRQKSQENTG